MKKIAVILLAAIILVACGQDDPVTTVESYLQAKVEGDEDTIRELLCSSMEAVFEREIRTIESVSGVTIEDMSCTRDGDSDVVRCEGKIVALYGTEKTEFPLTAYLVVKEDGVWKWCGEAP